MIGEVNGTGMSRVSCVCLGGRRRRRRRRVWDEPRNRRERAPASKQASGFVLCAPVPVGFVVREVWADGLTDGFSRDWSESGVEVRTPRHGMAWHGMALKQGIDVHTHSMHVHTMYVHAKCRNVQVPSPGAHGTLEPLGLRCG